MTADAEKMSTNCLICSTKIGVLSRNSIRIFEDDSKSEGDKPLIDIIRSVLEEDVNEENAHSVVLCKKCLKMFNEFDELESRMMEIRQKVNDNYRTTVQKITESVQIEDECNDHDYLDSVERIIEEDEQEIIDSKENQNLRDFLPLKQDDQEEHVGEIVEYLEEDFQEDDTHIMTSEEYIEDPIATVETPIHIKLEDQPSEMDISTEQITLVEPQKIIRPEKMKNDVKKKKDTKKKFMIMKEEFQEPIVFKEGSSYTCVLCSEKKKKYVADAKEIIIHMRDVHETRLYICDVCGMDFRKRNELSVHLDDHVATEEGDFQCEVCNRIFGNLRLFRIHKRIHYPQAKSWSCQHCGKRYSSKNLLDEHVNTHIGVRPYICETCGKDFASKYTYKAHAKTHEIRERPFECHQCSKTFLSQQNLNQHERTHLGVKEYVCHQCGKAFGSPHNLEVHNIVHTGYKPYICGSCGKAFARKAEIRDHERTHTGEKPYQCEFCGATFSQRSNLQSHKRATHYNDKRYKCDDCGKGFKRRRLLDYHIKAAHTGERPYKCETCAATFVYPEHYKKHMRIHTGEKPYLCEVCGKAFNSRDNRNAHRFIHSDKKPYECLVCGTGFMRKPLLYAHMQSQGHLNDTIVVNQPRLTTDDDQIIALPDGEVELMMDDPDSEQLGETELYVTELKDHVIIQQNGEHIFQEESILDITQEESTGQEDGNHVIVNAQIAYEGNEGIESKEGNENSENVYSYNDGEGDQTIVVPGTTEYKELMGDNKNSVRLVQIRIPSSTGVDNKGWISLVQQHT